MTGTMIICLVASVVAGAAFLLGWWLRGRSDAELIEQLEAELDSRKEVLYEVAHEPPALAARLAALHGDLAEEDPHPGPMWRYQAVAADTAWDIPVVRLDGIEDLEVWTATMVASTDRFLVELGIEPGR